MLGHKFLRRLKSKHPDIYGAPPELMRTPRMAALFDREDSMKFVADALRKGRVKLMPEKELCRLEDLRFGEHSPMPATPSAGEGSIPSKTGTGDRFRNPSAGGPTPDSRAGSDDSVMKSLPSDAALVKCQKDSGSGWAKARREIVVSTVPSNPEVTFGGGSRPIAGWQSSEIGGEMAIATVPGKSGWDAEPWMRDSTEAPIPGARVRALGRGSYDISQSSMMPVRSNWPYCST